MLKHYFIFLLAFLAGTSCQKSEELPEDQPGPVNYTSDKIKISLLNEKRKPLWISEQTISEVGKKYTIKKLDSTYQYFQDMLINNYSYRHEYNYYYDALNRLSKVDGNRIFEQHLSNSNGVEFSFLIEYEYYENAILPTSQIFEVDGKKEVYSCYDARYITPDFIAQHNRSPYSERNYLDYNLERPWPNHPFGDYELYIPPSDTLHIRNRLPWQYSRSSLNKWYLFLQNGGYSFNNDTKLAYHFNTDGRVDNIMYRNLHYRPSGEGTYPLLYVAERRRYFTLDPELSKLLERFFMPDKRLLPLLNMYGYYIDNRYLNPLVDDFTVASIASVDSTLYDIGGTLTTIHVQTTNSQVNRDNDQRISSMEMNILNNGVATGYIKIEFSYE